jgi:cellulose synthase/poly-beta-1,6-N-acetylglucosamine synthase-like glycosyltransferase
LNFGLLQTNAEVVVAIDADTILEPDALALLVRHFVDPAIGAVAGNAVVGNLRNAVTRMQALEYITSQNLERRAFEMIGAISVVPGAIGAWRRTALIQAGGFGHDTLAEDADVTIEIQRHGWKVIYEPRARALTEAPETLHAFMKQRFRWMFGMLQVACKNLFRASSLPLRISLVTLPNIFVFGFAFNLLAPLVDTMLLLTLFGILIDAIRTGAPQYDALGQIGAYWLLFQCVDIVVAFLGLRLEGSGTNFRLLPWIVVQRFTYRPLLYIVAVRALLAAIKGQFVGWGKLVRTGTVVALPNSQDERKLSSA